MSYLHILHSLNQWTIRLYFMMNIPSDDLDKLATAVRICSCTATRSLRSEDITFMGVISAKEVSRRPNPLPYNGMVKGLANGTKVTSS